MQDIFVPLYNKIQLPTTVLDYVFQFLQGENDTFHIKYGIKTGILEKQINKEHQAITNVLIHKHENKVIYVCEPQYEDEDYMHMDIAYYIESFSLKIPTIGYIDLIYRYKSVFQYTLEEMNKQDKELKKIHYFV